MNETCAAQPFAVEVGAFQYSNSERCTGAPRGAQSDAMLLNLGEVQHLLQEQSIYCAPPIVRADGVWLSVAGGSHLSPAHPHASRSLLAALHGLIDAFPVSDDVQQRQVTLPVRALHARKASARRHMGKLTPEVYPSMASLHVGPGQICAVNCGDSRIWRLRRTPIGQVEVTLLSRSSEALSKPDSVQRGICSDQPAGAVDDDVVKLDLRSSDDVWVHASYADVREDDVYLLSPAGILDIDVEMELAQVWNFDESLHRNLHALEHAWRARGVDQHVSVVALRCHGAHGGAAMNALSEAQALRTMPSRCAEIERQMLEYCRFDTYALVRAWWGFRVGLKAWVHCSRRFNFVLELRLSA
ncbi:hypothetical protein [Diaphorobacter caeni]|uniref:hypothetical protein n=1 Tax=Diaphorobacter caeni TaxID=2784387 RepID=UPI00188E4F36|nr:hypothetical protein [Diaphorobacter caeni]MBF5007275.1 hypothetical protein [Diaphorobacter caeni]